MIETEKIYCENCLETMSRMPDGFVSLTVTSPPYDNLRSYNGYEFDFEPIARELYRVTKKGGVVVWVVGDATINGSETGTSFRQALYFKEIGFNLHDTMIWHREAMPLSHNRYEQHFEYMFIFAKNAPVAFRGLRCPSRNAGVSKAIAYHSASTADVGKLGGKAGKIVTTYDEKLRGNVWSMLVGGGRADAIAFQHPATFPEQLVKDHILSWSNENDIIYDPFMGSGTTAKAAHQLKRNWIGSEISSEYVDLANKRLEPYLMQEALF